MSGAQSVCNSAVLKFAILSSFIRRFLTGLGVRLLLRLEAVHEMRDR